jgi:hypothetical protein
MTGPIAEFWRLATAMLLANLLTVAFVWACWNLSRLEREGVYNKPKQGKGLYLAMIVMVCLFGLGGFYLINAAPTSSAAAAVVDYRDFFKGP